MIRRSDLGRNDEKRVGFIQDDELSAEGIWVLKRGGGVTSMKIHRKKFNPYIRKLITGSKKTMEKCERLDLNAAPAVNQF